MPTQKFHRATVGRWSFTWQFGKFKFGIRRQNRTAGSIAFGCGVLMYMRKTYA